VSRGLANRQRAANSRSTPQPAADALARELASPQRLTASGFGPPARLLLALIERGMSLEALPQAAALVLLLDQPADPENPR
jgi:hypothetical protein